VVRDRQRRILLTEILLTGEFQGGATDTLLWRRGDT